MKRDGEIHVERVDKINEYIKENAGTATNACKQLGIPQSAYYASKKILKKQKKPRFARKVQTIVAEPIPRKSSRLICIIGDANDIAEVLKL